MREEKANASTVHRGGWTKARFLKTGDVLLTESGRLLQLESSRQVHSSKPVPVYNFEVEDNHSYYVSNDGVLVHNYDRDEIQSAKNTLLSGLAIREKLIKEGRPVPENLTKIINDAAKVAFSKPDSFEGSMNSFGKGVLGDLLETPSQARRLLDPNYIGSQSAENVKDVLNPADSDFYEIGREVGFEGKLTFGAKILSGLKKGFTSFRGLFKGKTASAEPGLVETGSADPNKLTLNKRQSLLDERLPNGKRPEVIIGEKPSNPSSSEIGPDGRLKITVIENADETKVGWLFDSEADKIAKSYGLRSGQKNRIYDSGVKTYLKQMETGSFDNFEVAGFYHNGKFIITDGHHRINAAIEYGIKTGDYSYLEKILSRGNFLQADPGSYGIDNIKFRTR